jgi:hypothetical protein
VRSSSENLEAELCRGGRVDEMALKMRHTLPNQITAHLFHSIYLRFAENKSMLPQFSMVQAIRTNGVQYEWIYRR